MHNDLIHWLVMYPVKYLNAPFLPYESLLDNIILSISTLSMSIKCFHLWKNFLSTPFSSKSEICFSILYNLKKKKNKSFMLIVLL